MVKMFRISGSNHIVEVDAYRFTEKSVWLIERSGNERRVSRSSDCCKYFESRDEAVDFSLEVLKENIRAAQALLDVNNDRLRIFKEREGIK